MADREQLTAPTGIVRVQGDRARRSPRPTRAGRATSVTQTLPRDGKGVNPFPTPIPSEAINQGLRSAPATSDGPGRAVPLAGAAAGTP